MPACLSEKRLLAQIDFLNLQEKGKPSKPIWSSKEPGQHIHFTVTTHLKSQNYYHSLNNSNFGTIFVQYHVQN